MATPERREELAKRFDYIKDPPWSDLLREGKCPLCGEIPDESALKDEISRAEFALSHICMKCQDVTFAEPEDDGA